MKTTVSWWWLFKNRACQAQRKLFVKTFGRWKTVPITAENLQRARNVGLELSWFIGKSYGINGRESYWLAVKAWRENDMQLLAKALRGEEPSS